MLAVGSGQGLVAEILVKYSIQACTRCYAQFFSPPTVVALALCWGQRTNGNDTVGNQRVARTKQQTLLNCHCHEPPTRLVLLYHQATSTSDISAMHGARMSVPPNSPGRETNHKHWITQYKHWSRSSAHVCAGPLLFLKDLRLRPVAVGTGDRPGRYAALLLLLASQTPGAVAKAKKYLFDTTSCLGSRWHGHC